MFVVFGCDGAAEHVNAASRVGIIPRVTTEARRPKISIPDRPIWKRLPRACSEERPDIDVLDAVLAVDPVLRRTLAEREKKWPVPIQGSHGSSCERSRQHVHSEVADPLKICLSEPLKRPLAHIAQRYLPSAPRPEHVGSPADLATGLAEQATGSVRQQATPKPD